MIYDLGLYSHIGEMIIHLHIIDLLSLGLSRVVKYIHNN